LEVEKRPNFGPLLGFMVMANAHRTLHPSFTKKSKREAFMVKKALDENFWINQI
jgi:hypothetical protein